MAVQYQRGRGRPAETRMLALRGGYHGDTTGAMSVTDPVSGMHAMFADVLPRHVFAPRPPAGIDADIATWARDAEHSSLEHADELAAVICEPVLQGAGGMHVYDPALPRGAARDRRRARPAAHPRRDRHRLRSDRRRCSRPSMPASRPTSCASARRSPVATLTLAATLCTTEVAAGIGDSESGVLMHGPTFMANPLACAVASANVELLSERDWQADVRRIEPALRAGLARAAAPPRRPRRPGARRRRRHPARPPGRRDPPPPQPRSPTACGSVRSATSSTRCRPTSSGTTTWPPIVHGHDRGGGRMTLRRLARAPRASTAAKPAWSVQLRPRDADSALIDLAGNDYLGLSRDPRVADAAAAPRVVWGAGAGASRLVTGTLDAARRAGGRAGRLHRRTRPRWRSPPATTRTSRSSLP